MPEERLIQAVQSAAQFIISINGTEIPRTIPRLSVNVTKMVNKLSSSIIVMQDGEASSGKFPLSEGDLFLPGNEIEISAGEVKNPINIFKGIIIKQSLKIREQSAPQLIVECRHKGVKATVGRKSACYHDKSDSDIMNTVLKALGFTSGELDIEDSDVMHKELVQYNSTDWDFILNRAEVIGKMVLTNDETISVKAPEVTGNAVLSLLYGATIIELDAEMDSRNQYASVKTQSWDMATQEVAESEGSEPENMEEQGDFSNDELADVIGLETFILNYPGTLTPEERKSWANAQILKSRLSKIRGRVKFDGMATINPGDVVELNGLGSRFNGKALVSGVRHDLDMVYGWKTQVQFGHNLEWFGEEQHIAAPKAGGLLPGAIGLHIGIVTDNEDPDGEQRVRVKVPYINSEDEGVWARMALADAGAERGLFFRPELDDEVIIGFLYDDPRQPVILGMLHSSAKTPPISPSNDNQQKGYTSREKMKLIFDDEKKSVVIETPAGNKLTISDDAKGLVLEDENSNKIEMNSEGITITAVKKLELIGGTELAIGGPQIKMNGDTSVEIVGGGSAKVESSGSLDLKGAIVKIN